MGHCIEAFIAQPETLQPLATRYRHTHIIPLEQGWSLLPLIDDLYDEIHNYAPHTPDPYEELWRLTQRLEQIAMELSAHGMIAYIETEYHGG